LDFSSEYSRREEQEPTQCPDKNSTRGSEFAKHAGLLEHDCAKAEVFRHNREKMFTPEDIKEFFYGSQILIGVLFFASLFIFRGGLRDQPSQFNELGSNESPKRKAGEPDNLLADARMETQQSQAKRSAKILMLPGIRIDGPAHEVLGVGVAADEKSVQKAYRELMKRYHPDLVGPPGSREWKDAQKIAEAINLAKEEMIRTIRARKSS
jgi:hypothetical protein